ncbi:hypothetical protein EXIGLDRAFT_745528 [Exidia glandulosa HHB12029]|uniref:Uncharacterized protein n=1 Tax=Exidia glandulosa HHB12029 TaxID=1314781 RepID=A0A165NH51_EXIGL|nr:hypothetical protein EXIGLDRAFT_745528 [Exidia glandulosa HHB12029]
MQFFVLAASLAVAVSGVFAAPSPAPLPMAAVPNDAVIAKRDWCWDDGFNKGWSDKWQLCANGQGEWGPVPHGQTDGCGYNGQPVESFRAGYQYAVDLKRNCDF